ncbi:hypothetical protein KC929_01975 [Patescibacteria group bacterium]|nr:hypothetical protein [Patescibacteria group bacterium]
MTRLEDQFNEDGFNSTPLGEFSRLDSLEAGSESYSISHSNRETIIELTNKVQTLELIINSYNEVLQGYIKEVSRTTSDIEQLESRLRTQIDRSKLDFITVIGVFVSIFTFLSIEVQILKFLENFWVTIGFSFILFSLLLSFGLVLHFVTERMIPVERPYKAPKTVIYIILGTFVVSLVFFIIGHFYEKTNLLSEINLIKESMNQIESSSDNQILNFTSYEYDQR